ncbi:MAG: multicopper oxidase domain-containing protein [Saprospiraceae bacterium]|nr:multicopper oxidase domain-containing protein [Candidatus Brachybacter algidus]
MRHAGSLSPHRAALPYEGPFYFNGQSFDMMRIDYTVPLNHIEVWSISNQSMMAHPFHIHDVSFHS